MAKETDEQLTDRYVAEAAMRMLAEWNVRGRFFNVGSMGNGCPEDGVYVELSSKRVEDRDDLFSKKKRVVVYAHELTIRNPAEPDKDYEPKIADVIVEALRRWEGLGISEEVQLMGSDSI